MSAINYTNGIASNIYEPSLNDMVKGVTTNEAYIIPSYSSRFNRILPSNITKLNIDRQKTSDDLVAAARTFEPYEQLTGISQVRFTQGRVDNGNPNITAGVGT